MSTIDANDSASLEQLNALAQETEDELMDLLQSLEQWTEGQQQQQDSEESDFSTCIKKEDLSSTSLLCQLEAETEKLRTTNEVLRDKLDHLESSENETISALRSQVQLLQSDATNQQSKREAGTEQVQESATDSKVQRSSWTVRTHLLLCLFQCATFFFAKSDTTANLNTWLTYSYSISNPVQVAIRQRLDDIERQLKPLVHQFEERQQHTSFLLQNAYSRLDINQNVQELLDTWRQVSSKEFIGGFQENYLSAEQSLMRQLHQVDFQHIKVSITRHSMDLRNCLREIWLYVQVLYDRVDLESWFLNLLTTTRSILQEAVRRQTQQFPLLLSLDEASKYPLALMTGILEKYLVAPALDDDEEEWNSTQEPAVDLVYDEYSENNSTLYYDPILTTTNTTTGLLLPNEENDDSDDNDMTKYYYLGKYEQLCRELSEQCPKLVDQHAYLHDHTVVHQQLERNQSPIVSFFRLFYDIENDPYLVQHEWEVLFFE